MVININPNRINISNAPGRADRRRAKTDDSGNVFIAPARADVNFIPSAETLSTLIRSAVSALRRGVYWDRGTILNLLA